MHYLLIGGVVLIVGAFLSLVLRNNRQRAGAAVVSQAVATVLTLLAVRPVLAGTSVLEAVWPWSFPVETVRVQVDSLSAFFLSWSLPLTLLGTIYAIGYLRPYFQENRNGGHHFALLNMVSLSFLIIYSVQNALVFLFGWEIAAVSAWLLVIWDYRNQKIRFAGFNYLVSTHVGLFVLVAAFMLMHSQTASMDFDRFSEFLAQPGRLRNSAFILLATSCALKSAFFPFHSWLPRAHSAAPAHVSSLMSGVIHKAGLFAFLRFTLMIGRPEEWMGWCVLGFGCASALFGVLYTATQRDLKRLLGYSSTENVGIVAIGFGIGYLGLSWNRPGLIMVGFGGGLLHIVNHAVFKCLMFYAAGAVYRATHSVDLERLGGLARTMPRTTAMFLIGGLAMSALPPFNGFLGEYLMFSGLFSGSAPSAVTSIAFVGTAGLLALVGGISGLCMTRAFGVAFLGTRRDESIHVGRDPPFSMSMPMTIHALAVIAIGLSPVFALRWVTSATSLFQLSAPIETTSELRNTLVPLETYTRVFAVLIVALCALGWRASRRARVSTTWAGGYTAGNARMQISGTSFSLQISRIFESFLPRLRREKPTQGIFPAEPGHIATHSADAVEQRIFEVIGQGEHWVTRGSERISEGPRFAFGAGLLVLIVMVGWLVAESAR